MAFPIFAVISAASKAGGGIVSGIGDAQAAKKMFQEDEEEELALLKKKQKAGELGLSDKERLGLEQQFLSAGSAAQRDQQQQRLQAASLQGQASGVSARDVFLQEQAAQSVALGTRQEQNRLLAGMDAQAVAEDEARIQTLQAQRNQAEADKTRGIAKAISSGVGAPEQQAAQQQQHRQNIEVAQAQQGTQTTQELVSQYKGPQQSTGTQQSTGYDWSSKSGTYNTSTGSF